MQNRLLDSRVFLRTKFCFKTKRKSQSSASRIPSVIPSPSLLLSSEFEDSSQCLDWEHMLRFKKILVLCQDGTEEMLAENSERELLRSTDQVVWRNRERGWGWAIPNETSSLSERDGSFYCKRKENSGMTRTLPIWCDTIKYKQSSSLMTFSTSRL